MRVTENLAADDEETVRELLSELLTREGYQVVLAASGTETRTIGQRENPAAILVDVEVPG